MIIITSFTFLCLNFSSVMDFIFLSLITLSVGFAATSLKDLLGDSPVMFFQHSWSYLNPSFIIHPAPAHLVCHDPLCDLLICFPPSNSLHICIIIAFYQICCKVSNKRSLWINMSLSISKLILTWACLQWIVYHKSFGCQEVIWL